MNEVTEIFNQHGIGWTPLKFSSRPPGLSKVFDIYNIKKAARRLHKQNRFHIVHCRSYISSFAGLELKRRFGVTFVFDMRGFWADERVEGNIWKLSNPFFRLTYNYFKKREKDFFSQADAVVSLTHKGKALIGQIAGEETAARTTVIPCCTDLELFSSHSISEDQKDKLRGSLELEKDDFVISYLGSIGTWYMTEEMLAFFRRLLVKLPGARFLFITPEDPAFIMQKVRTAGIDTASIRIQKASRKQVPALLSLSDVSIFFIKQVFSKKASSPTKQGEIMSMGIPFITNTQIGDTDQLVKETGVGILIDSFNDDAYDKAIEQIPSLLSLDPAHIRQCAISHFNLENGVNQYHNIYKSLTLNESD